MADLEELLTSLALSLHHSKTICRPPNLPRPPASTISRRNNLRARPYPLSIQDSNENTQHGNLTHTACRAPEAVKLSDLPHESTLEDNHDRCMEGDEGLHSTFANTVYQRLERSFAELQDIRKQIAPFAFPFPPRTSVATLSPRNIKGRVKARGVKVTSEEHIHPIRDNFNSNIVPPKITKGRIYQLPGNNSVHRDHPNPSPSSGRPRTSQSAGDPYK